MTKEIDQRAQRHEPASKRTHDSNDRPESPPVEPDVARVAPEAPDIRPGTIDHVEGSPNQIAAADAGRAKYNTRDDGHGKVTTDDPLDHIADADKRDKEV